ncbi:MAG TPA: DUF4230 domain-containing protein [Saprospiraceae bacterium]|nr:DUF4230 domain-containing protein [Saprospiraceae bacterium]
MLKRLGTLILGLAILACVALAWYVSRSLFHLKKQKAETAEVILEQMKSVSKLVTAEGYFSEIYDYKDYYQWDISPLRKKALLRVKAKVIMGYDLEKLQFSIDSETKRIVITDSAFPEIIALEHDIDYYDLTEGTFNSFSEDDLNMLNAHARNFISEVAMQSDLVKLANTRKEEIFKTLRTIAETADYELKIEKNAAGPSIR